MFVNPSDPEMVERLQQVRTIAVVGLSDKPVRDSYGVATYLNEMGYTIAPVNPRIRMWEGHQSFPDLATAIGACDSVGKSLDMVVVFRRSSEVKDLLKECVRLGVPAVWCQLGVIDWEAATWARDHGLWIVMDHCVAVEHRRLVGKPLAR